MKYIILKIMVSMIVIIIFLGNSWWCLFISDKSPIHLLIWWTIVTFTLVFGGMGALSFISDKEAGL